MAWTHYTIHYVNDPKNADVLYGDRPEHAALKELRKSLEASELAYSDVTNNTGPHALSRCYVWVLGLCVTLSSGVFWLFFMRKSWLIVNIKANSKIDNPLPPWEGPGGPGLDGNLANLVNLYGWATLGVWVVSFLLYKLFTCHANSRAKQLLAEREKEGPATASGATEVQVSAVSKEHDL
jgi:hypothetical protein